MTGKLMCYEIRFKTRLCVGSDKLMCVSMPAPISQKRISGVLLYCSWPYFFDTGSLTELETPFVCLFCLGFVLLIWLARKPLRSVCLHISSPHWGLWVYEAIGFHMDSVDISSDPRACVSNTLASFLARIWDKRSGVLYIRWAYGHRIHTSLL